MRKDGVSKKEVARNFKLSPSRIYLIERRDAADRSMCERRAKSREEIQAVADLDRMWPVNDLVDAIGLIVVTRKRLLDHFAEVGKQQITLQEFMDMCLDAPVERLDLMMSSLWWVRGVGKIGFWSVVNGLTGMDLGDRCNEEWRKILVKVKQESEVKPPAS
jgi:hypothetical protein